MGCTMCLLLLSACSSSGGRRQLTDGDIQSVDNSDVSVAADILSGLDAEDTQTRFDSGLPEDASSDGADGVSGGSSDDGMDGSDATVSSSAGDGTDQMDGSVGVDGADQSDGADQTDAGVEVFGGVVVSQVENPNLQVGAVSARFTNVADPEPEKVTQLGNCYAYSPSPQGPQSAGLSIGDIVFSGLSQPLTMSPTVGPDGGFTYSSGLSDTHPSILGTSSEVTIQASGGEDLDAVTVTLQVPPPVNITAPTADAKTSQPLTISWTPTPDISTSIRLDIAIYDSSGEAKPGNLIACELSDDSGQYVVSPALLSLLPTSGGGPFNPNILVVGVTRVVSQQVTVNGATGSGTLGFAVTRSAGTGVLVE